MYQQFLSENRTVAPTFFSSPKDKVNFYQWWIEAQLNYKTKILFFF